MDDEPNASAKESAEAEPATKPWVEPKLVRLEAGEARTGSSIFYDGISFPS